MGHLAPMALRTEPGLSLSCALRTCRACLHGCTCRCHDTVTIPGLGIGIVHYAGRCGQCDWRGPKRHVRADANTDAEHHRKGHQ